MSITTCSLCGKQGVAMDLWKNGYACTDEEKCKRNREKLVDSESCPCFMGGSCPTEYVHLNDVWKG
jgi:hypothetical protein